MTLPWIVNANSAPWLQQQPTYPRVISIYRNSTVAGTNDAIGDVGYSGAEQGITTDGQGEVLIVKGLSAAIQLKAGRSTSKSTELPMDAITKPVWTIFIPATSISIYSIRDRDIIYDDEQYRYEVGSNYWTSFGYELSTIREEA